jgi:hypothetical protein
VSLVIMQEVEVWMYRHLDFAPQLISCGPPSPPQSKTSQTSRIWPLFFFPEQTNTTTNTASHIGPGGGLLFSRAAVGD